MEGLRTKNIHFYPACINLRIIRPKLLRLFLLVYKQKRKGSIA